MRKPLFALFALLALFAAACSDDGGGNEDSDSTDSTESSDSTESTSTTAAGLELAEWASQADGICAEAGEQLDALGEPSDAEDLIEMLPDAIEISSGELEELEALGLPAESADSAEELLSVARQRIDLLQQMHDDIDGGADPEAVFTEVNTEVEALSSQASDLADDLGLEECGGGGDTTDPTTDPTTDTTSGGDPGDVPVTGDAVIDEMLAQCAEGNGIACDQAYALTEVGSDAEAFADTCGDTEDPGSVCASILQGSKVEPELYDGDGYGDDATLDGYYDECEAGDMAQCDLLFLVSPVGSAYEEFGGTCGGTFGLEDSPFSCVTGS
jgi:hypothetical protein